MTLNTKLQPAWRWFHGLRGEGRTCARERGGTDLGVTACGVHGKQIRVTWGPTGFVLGATSSPAVSCDGGSAGPKREGVGPQGWTGSFCFALFTRRRVLRPACGPHPRAGALGVGEGSRPAASFDGPPYWP
ncbi:hypothetical protein CRG98_042637 [Punica granatum]|uniref:Uncharacterized protein n=1 Tax=Punica granatum TaxID=22663 RepID=A0A2I0I0D6_PUNGR|nr:hypothetical protein CRG98_042637 [Punica granatum]